MEGHSRKLSEHLEDYLETITELESEHGSARLTDIAEAMNVKKPSVVSALNSLSERGFIVYEKYKPVNLTKEGRALADSIQRKHELLRVFFTDVLGVDSAGANVAACKMEHALEDDIMRKLVKFLEDMGVGGASRENKKTRK